jgi:hypothetical protein
MHAPAVQHTVDSRIYLIFGVPDILFWEVMKSVLISDSHVAYAIGSKSTVSDLLSSCVNIVRHPGDHWF